MIDFIQIQTTFPDEMTARAAAQSLAQRHLVACVQVIGPILSYYHWDGALQTSTEWLCLLKTRKMLFDLVSESIRAIHPYETPQIVAVPIVEMNMLYRNWLVAETSRCTSK